MQNKEQENPDGESAIELIPLIVNRHVRLKIEGMTCTSCANSVERTLKSVKGVETAIVALIQEFAEVEFNEQICSVESLIEAIENCGFNASVAHQSKQKTNTTVCQLRIHGMVCSSCSNGITKELEALKGVHSVRISLALGEADIEYDTRVSKDMILQKIKDIGFEAELIGISSSDFLTLSISDIKYASFARKIEESLEKVTGVINAHLNLLTSEAEIEFNPNLVGPRDLIRQVQILGYSCELRTETEKGSPMQSEVAHWRRLFFLSLVFTIPVAIMAMLLPRIPGIKSWIKKEIGGIPFDVLFKWILATPVQFVIGWGFQVGAIRALRHGTANMDVLVALGTDASYIYSLISVISHRLMHHHQEDYSPTDFFETSALLISFILLGKYLETGAKGRTYGAIAKLIQLMPDSAILVDLGKDSQIIHEEEIEAPLVQKGDYLKVYPGGRIPADGQVVVGSSYVDESMITGESNPISKTEGDSVIGGTVNKGGVLIVRAQRVGADTALSQIVRLVENAQLSKAPIQVYADRVSSVFVPVVLVMALMTWLAWYLSGINGGYPEEWLPQGHNYFLFSLLFGIAVLVIACPCALGLATPTAVMVGTGIGAQLGILIKGGDALERAHKVDTVLFDKTGTLTAGKPSVVSEQIFVDGVSLEHVYCLAASAEKETDHPLSNAIMDRSKAVMKTSGEGDSDLSWIWPNINPEVKPGRGVVCWSKADPSLSAIFGGGSSSTHLKVTIGNQQLMSEEQIELSKNIGAYCRLEQSRGKTAVILAVELVPVAVISIADPPKAEARSVISLLNQLGIQCYMVTGDNWNTARAIAERLGIGNVIAEVMPAMKARKVKQLQREGHVVAMVGDGVNDAPALVAADVGMAIGSGTDTAIEAADYVLMHDNLEDVVTAIDLSKKTFSRIQLNYFWAFLYNTLMIPVAAGVLYPSMKLQLPPWVAGGAMALSSFSVVCSSLLLRRYRPPTSDLHTID